LEEGAEKSVQSNGKVEKNTAWKMMKLYAGRGIGKLFPVFTHIQPEENSS
jgi:D-lyxose ketol-isomerase